MPLEAAEVVPEIAAADRSLAPERAEAIDDGPGTAPIALPAQERLSLGRDRTLGSGVIGGDAAVVDERSSLLDHWAVRTIGALSIVIGLALLLRLLARSVAGHAGGIRGQLGAGGRAPSGVLSVLARFPIARGQTLVLLQLDRRVLLLNQTPAGFATLTELVDPEEVASLARKCEAGSRSGRDGTSGFDSVLRAMERDPEVGTGRLDGAAHARGAATRTVEEAHDDSVGRAQALIRATRRGNAALGGGIA